MLASPRSQASWNRSSSSRPRQRALEQAGEVEVVLGQEDRPPQGHQILHRDMIAQRQPVGAGGGHARLLQGTHQPLLQDAAPPEQDHHVARPDRLAGTLQHLAAIQPVADRPGDGPRHTALGLVADPRRARQRPGLAGRLGLRRAGQRPQLDQAGVVGALGAVVQDAPRIDHARLCFRQCENGVDRRQDRGHRPEGPVEQLGIDRPAGGRGPRRQALAHGTEVGEVGTLETVDRLLLVADHEQGSRIVARAVASEELLGQLEHDRPLARAGVLGLVDQDMVDARIQLVEHPLGLARFVQQLAGALDQVVIVEHRPLRLQRLVSIDGGEGDAQQGLAAARHEEGAQPVARRTIRACSSTQRAPARPHRRRIFSVARCLQRRRRSTLSESSGRVPGQQAIGPIRLLPRSARRQEASDRAHNRWLEPPASDGRSEPSEPGRIEYRRRRMPAARVSGGSQSRAPRPSTAVDRRHQRFDVPPCERCPTSPSARPGAPMASTIVVVQRAVRHASPPAAPAPGRPACHGRAPSAARARAPRRSAPARSGRRWSRNAAPPRPRAGTGAAGRRTGRGWS